MADSSSGSDTGKGHAGCFDETKDKTRTGARISHGGTTDGTLEPETVLGEPVQRFKKEHNGEKTSKISGGHTDETYDKDKTSKEKAPKTELSVEDSCEKEGSEIDQTFVGNKYGGQDKIPGRGSVDTCDVNSNQNSGVECAHPIVENISEETKNKSGQTHPLGHDQKLENGLDKRGLGVAETNREHTARYEMSQISIKGTHELNKVNIPVSLVNEGEGRETTEEEMSQVASAEKCYDKQLEEKKDGGKINREVLAKSGNSFKADSSNVHLDKTEKGIAVSVNTEQEDSIPRAQKSPTNLTAASNIEKTYKPRQECTPDFDAIGILKVNIHEGTSGQIVAETAKKFSQQEANHTPEGHGETSDGRTGQESFYGIPEIVNKTTSSSATASNLSSDETTLARKIECQETDQAESSPSNDSSEGTEPVLKLLIKYLKKQGKRTEADLSKHTVPCSMNLQLMWNFFMLTDCGKQMLDAIAGNHHCKVSLSTDDNFKEFFIFQVLNTPFHDESDVKYFVDGVLHNIEICAKESLCIDTIGIDPKIQDEVRERIKDGQELANAWVEFVGEDNPLTVYTICPKDQQQVVMQKITDIITDVTKSFNSHKEMVTADFMWQTVMTRFEYLKELGLQFPSTEIIRDKSLNAFLLKGPRDEVKSVARHLKELLKMAHKDVHEKVFSPGYQFEIFTSSEMCDYIDKSLPKLPVIWIPNLLTKEIHLFSRNPELLNGMDKSIKGCIEERLYPLSNKHSELPSEQMKLLKKLMKKHEGKIVIHLSQSPTGLLLTTADDIFKDVYAAVQTIISSEIDEVHLETFVPEKLDGKDEQPGSKSQISNPGIEMKDLSSEKVSDVVPNITRSLEVKDKNLFKKLLMEYMETFNKIAKEHCVSIKICETQSRAGFELKGEEKEVQFIYDAIKLQEQQFQQDISVIAGATGKVHKQMLPNSDAAGKSGCSEMSGQLLTDSGLASEDRATAMVSCEKIFLVENRSVYECMIKVVRWIKKTGLEHTVKVRELNEPQRVGFVLQGFSDRVLEMTDYMKKVQEGIITQKYSAFSASDVSYLGSTEGKQILAKLEEENNCTIEITYPGKIALVEDLYSGGTMGSCMMVTFIFPHDHSVILFKGEVEKCTTDIIVTPVMSPFSSTGPQKSPFISTESTKLSMYVPLCISKAKHSLIQNICDTLCYTGDKQCGKVGFALSPLGGWDLRKYIKIFLFAINDFFCKSRGITGTKVYLCTSEIDMFARMKVVAIDYFSSFITGHNRAGDSYTVDFDASSIKEPVLHFDKIEVRVEAGELSQMEADVIVNTTSEKLELNGGTISKSILKAAGQTIQDECKKAYPNGISLGKVAQTSGGRMKCKNIFHGALKPHESKDWDKILKKFVDACLTTASNMKFKSIAFPVLGTGNLELPRDRVAHIMTSCVKEFSSRKFITLEKVTFVIYHTDEITLKVFQDTILKFKPAEKEKTESSDIEIHVTGLKDKVNKVIASIKTELKRLTYEDHLASEDKLKQNIPSTISQPSKGAAVEHKISGASMNLASMDYSEEKCCAVVSGEIRSKEELEKDIANFWRRPKHVVYPYDMEKKTALIIFECEEDATSFLNQNSTSLPYKIQSLEPQILQKLETVAETVVKRASDMGQLDTLVKEIKEKSGVEVITLGNQVFLKGVTAIQMQIAQSCLEEFCEVNLHILLRQGIKITSPLCSQDEGYIVDKIEGVSEIEFKALKILIDDINAKSIDVVWKDNAILITTQLKSTSEIIQTLNIQLKALRGRQMEEIFVDEDYKNVVRDVIAEMQSKDAICIYDEEKGQVIMYCVRQDDIMKFKHKLKFKSGKLKETGRSNKRFAENTQSMEASQGNSSSSGRSAVIRHEFSWSKNASSVEIFYTKEKIKVAVYTADVLNLPVDCIVNAANDRMQHGGGVAKVIADAAGPELLQEGDAIIMKKGRIPVGGQVTTTAGRLPYRCIIHTVGPCWSDYQPHNLLNVQKCAGDLYAAIYGCFTEAERNGLSTVALPAVSSGIYAVPQEMFAVQYARAVFDYSTKSEQGKSLTEIHFIDRLPHLVKLMQDTFRTMIKNGNVPNYNIQKYVTSSSNYQELQSKETGRKGHKDGDNAGKSSQCETTKLGFPIHYESTEHTKKQFVFQISAKPVVRVYDGDILKLKNMDAIVCPDDTKGSGKGAVAAELRKKHKYRQQKESCFKLEKPEIGDVAISSGEEHPYHVIVHVVIESDSHQKPEFKHTMEKSFDNILRKTNKWVKVKTLAMPLFGLKNVSLEKPWAELFLDRFAAFCYEVRNPNIAEIHIITPVSSSSAYSTLKNVFCDFAAKIKSAQYLQLPPNSDSKVSK